MKPYTQSRNEVKSSKKRGKKVRSDEIVDLRADKEVNVILENIERLDGLVAAHSTALEAAREERRIEFQSLLKKTNGAKKGISTGWIIRFVTVCVPEKIVEPYEFWYFKVRRIPVFGRKDSSSNNLKVVS